MGGDRQRQRMSRVGDLAVTEGCEAKRSMALSAEGSQRTPRELGKIHQCCKEQQSPANKMTGLSSAHCKEERPGMAVNSCQPLDGSKLGNQYGSL
jgi:hypothetical protein